MRENAAKDPVLCQPGLDCHAQSEEMLISRHLCCETREKVLENFRKHETNINNPVFDLSCYEISGQLECVSNRHFIMKLPVVLFIYKRCCSFFLFPFNH